MELLTALFNRRLLVVLASALVLSQCSAPVSVRSVKPSAHAATVATAGMSKTEQALQEVYGASQRLASGDASAITDYNHWVGRFIERLEASGADPWSGPLQMRTASPTGGMSLRASAPAGCAPRVNQLIPTDTMLFKGDHATHRVSVPGIGAPIIEAEPKAKIGYVEARTKLPLRNLTALIRFNGNAATLELVDPYQIESVDIFGKHYPLAADPAAAVMLGMSRSRVDKLGLVRLLRPGRYASTARLNFLQPYDQERIPVLFIHGLDSTPATFAPLYFELLKDPEIRRRYQFWVFSYPSGFPYPYPASLLRKQLDQVDKDFPDHKEMVVIGHSMGSLITRLLVTDVGDKMWRKAFGTAPADTKMAGLSRQVLTDAIVFNHNDKTSRAVFISGPHRGSEIATSWIGRLFGKIVRLPGFMADIRDSVVSVASLDRSGVAFQRVPNSIDTLKPSNRFVKEINTYPITPGIPYHSIMGDRGKGDTPNSSDGVVAYWSSHLDGATSEKIVPSGHGAHQHPVGMEEVRRILHQHLLENAR